MTLKACDIESYDEKRAMRASLARSTFTRFLKKLSDKEVKVLTSIPWKGWVECFGKMLRTLAVKFPEKKLCEKTVSFEDQVLFVLEKLR